MKTGHWKLSGGRRRDASEEAEADCREFRGLGWERSGWCSQG